MWERDRATGHPGTRAFDSGNSARILVLRDRDPARRFPWYSAMMPAHGLHRGFRSRVVSGMEISPVSAPFPGHWKQVPEIRELVPSIPPLVPKSWEPVPEAQEQVPKAPERVSGVSALAPGSPEQVPKARKLVPKIPARVPKTQALAPRVPEPVPSLQKSAPDCSKKKTHPKISAVRSTPSNKRIVYPSHMSFRFLECVIRVPGQGIVTQ